MSKRANDVPDAQDVLTRTEEVLANPKQHEEWWSTVQRAPVLVLIEATAQLSATPASDHDRAAKIKARREAIISEIERRTMHDLDASTTKLTWVGTILALIGTAAAVLQVLQIFHLIP